MASSSILEWVSPDIDCPFASISSLTESYRWRYQEQTGIRDPNHCVRPLRYRIGVRVRALLSLMPSFIPHTKSRLIGTFAKKRRYIVLFRWVLIAHVLFSIASGSFALYRFFVDAPATVRSCIGGSKNEDAVEACKNGVNILKGVLIGVFLFVWVMEICELLASNVSPPVLILQGAVLSSKGTPPNSPKKNG